MKIVMVAGGSGGHIYPAVSLAKECIKKGHEVSFIGANDRMEKEVIPSLGLPFIGLDVKTTRGGILQKVSSVLSMVTSYQKVKKILKNNADVVIGFGNYISVPVVLAAKKLGIKTILHEQNSFVGRANRMLDEKVDLIIGSYEENRKQFKNPNTVILGNPQSSIASLVEKDESVITELGLDPKKKILVIFMGSLGSETVMEHILEYFKKTDGSYQIVYATGSKHYHKAKDYENDYIKIREKIDGVKVMKSATLLLSRAGATTLAEITSIGMPSVLIPSPYVPNNHQYYNAKALVDKKAAVMIEEKNLSADVLKEKIDALIHDEVALEELSKNARQQGNDHVIEDMIKRIEEI